MYYDNACTRQATPFQEVNALLRTQQKNITQNSITTDSMQLYITECMSFY